MMNNETRLLMTIALAFLLGLAAGGALVWLTLRGRFAAGLQQGRAELAVDLATAAERARATEAELARLAAAHAALERQATEWRDALDQVRDDLAMLTERASRLPGVEAKLAAAETRAAALAAELAELTARADAERRLGEEKLALLQTAREELADRFKTLANDILEEKAKRFTEQNQANIGQLLAPLRERMTEFKAKVEEIHHQDTQQQATLRAELAQLKELNRQITEEAHGLATALKGQAKKQGNWGELVLGNVLDRSGLREGQDYRREVSFSTEEGRKRPDVVVYLPQGKHLVIDAKVSLNAYTRYVNAEDEAERRQALREHVEAVASRIEELSDRAYFELPGLNTPEMVFMFVPIESAFVEALRADEELFQKAIGRNVLVATPTTLLTSLNIVRQLWRFEEQNAHAAELAERAGKIYKKLVGFLDSMQGLGSQLDKAKDSFNKAMGQLVSGKGNLIGQAKDFERLGVSVQTALPEQLVARAALELDNLPASGDAPDAYPERPD